MPLSFSPNLFAIAINKGSHTGERLRENKEAVLVIPAVGSEGFIFGCGSKNGKDVNKVQEFGIELKSINGTNIQIPVHSTAAVIGKLIRYEETGDHNLYILEVKGAYGDETETPLFAWKGYAEVNTAVRGEQG